MGTKEPYIQALTASLLERWPLPIPSEKADKEDRGHVLIIGGSREIPGAVLLAATAALRSGAGKLTMAVPRSVAPGLALAMPEARVIAIKETRSGGMVADDAYRLGHLGDQVASLLVGPGMVDEDRSAEFARELLPYFRNSVTLLDAYAMSALAGYSTDQPLILTPHFGEMAHLTGDSKTEVAADPVRYVHGAAKHWKACVALKGPNTYVAQAHGPVLRFRGGIPGLGVSGSGDTLAGIIAGIAARGAPAIQACAWGVVLHALAGAALTRQHGPLGFLARELPGPIPRLLDVLGATRR